MKPKVLMLGWEFPPEISGGLGIAFHAICKALAPLAEVTIIVPKLDKTVKIPGAEIIGIGEIDLDKFFEEEEIIKLEGMIKDNRIEIDVSPYPVYPLKTDVSVTTTTTTTTTATATKTVSRTPGDIHSLHKNFRDAELYGNEVVNMVRYFAEITELIASKLSFDIIHAHDWMTFEAGIRLKKKFGKPLILHVHSLNFDRVGPEQEGVVYQIEKDAFQAADMILPVSHYTGSIIREHYEVEPERISPVHNGIDPVKTFKTEKKFPEKLILFMGRITLQKGPEYFLETASKVIDKYPAVRFAIAGTGDQLNRLIEEGAYIEISQKLHFTGFLERKKVYSLLSMADIFCMPSISEPFGLTALEAVQFGIPVIITKKSGAAEVLPSAFLADFWDTDLMASQILSLLTDQNLYDSKVKEGKKDIQKISWNKTAENILKEYRKVIP
ncbi:MAG: glycosyltransferase [Cyclobacteriaceae bacterium]|nr:glycosyltransferase [Cyclobacteriaceae bacterium]